MPANYLDAGHLDHGYAMTIHKAQGLTADEALVLATDDLYQEAGYTALSRARLETRVYVAGDDFLDDPPVEDGHQPGGRPPRSQSANLDRWLERSQPAGLALDR